MIFNDLSQVLPFINTALAVAVIAGTIAAFRYGHERGNAEQFAATLTALQAEIAALKDKVARLEASNERLRRLIGMLRTALRRRGIEIRIEPDTVTITDAHGTQSLGNFMFGTTSEDGNRGDSTVDNGVSY